jgi:L-ascorbate metabolism protein UlaG (beta-lactamase superfamily)
VRSAHLPTGFATGSIGGPLSLPASAGDFREGDCYSLLIEHGNRKILVQGSAGFVPDALKGRSADVVYLGVGGLGATREAYQDDYWREMVRTVGARRVIPIHWDNFYRPLEDGLVPNRDFYGLMNSILARGKAEGVDIRLSPQWLPVDPFAGF